MEPDLNRELIAQTLGFHGLPLIKTWNEENGMNSLTRLGLQQNNINTNVYHERLKVLNFTDRTKRLRLHRFICNKSETLFENFREDPTDKRIKKLVSSGGKEVRKVSHIVFKAFLDILGDPIPPFEFYASIDKDERLRRFFSVSSFNYCNSINSKESSRVLLI